MGLWGKLFGSNEHNAKDPQGHLKTKNYRKLDWVIDNEEYKKQDYIGSTEYIVPSDSTMNEIIGEMNTGKTFPVQDLFFRIDYIGRKNEWYKKRDYLFKELILKKKDDAEEIYVLEGTGRFVKEDYTGATLETIDEETSIYAEISYKDSSIEIKNCSGFNQHTDNWYAFMLFFKVLEDFKYPTARK
jgi:hypothetical protein